MRKEQITRRTGETNINMEFSLDGTGKTEIQTGVGFFDHMLTAFTKHGRFDLAVNCDGDIEVDQHHSVEDVGIVLGQAFNVEGMKDKVGDFDTELVEEFFIAFTSHAKITLHINLDYGKNTHHIIESIFKSFGRALRVASTINPDIQGVPSTKGTL